MVTFQNFRLTQFKCCASNINKNRFKFLPSQLLLSSISSVKLTLPLNRYSTPVVIKIFDWSTKLYFVDYCTTIIMKRATNSRLTFWYYNRSLLNQVIYKFNDFKEHKSKRCFISSLTMLIIFLFYFLLHDFSPLSFI